jgi:uncharacterized protein
MFIELNQTEDPEIDFYHIYQPDALLLNAETVRLAEPLEVQGKVRKQPIGVKLIGQLKTALEVFCNRCLQNFNFPLNVQFEENFVTSEDFSSQSELELKNDTDFSLSVFDGERINLDEAVQEQIWLNLPDRLLCRENCQGICPHCGANKNEVNCHCEVKEIDPRWQKLRDLTK